MNESKSKRVDTVNVIEFADDDLLSITSYEESEEGNIEASAHFRQCATAICPEDECAVDSDGCLIDNDGDAETDMEDRLEQTRRDEKNGLYPNKSDIAN